MNKLLLVGALLASSTTFAQKNKEYKASNGLTYHIGDTVLMAKGTGNEGRFLTLGVTGFSAIVNFNRQTNGDNLWANRFFENGKGVIKKIKEMKFAGTIKPYFILDFHQGANYMLLIEDAIKSCEITPCAKPE